jgi:hypothetical protein
MAQLTDVGNLWRTLNFMGTETHTISYANEQFRVERKVVKLASRYITLSVNRDYITVMGQLPPENPIFCPYLWRKDGDWVDNR